METPTAIKLCDALQTSGEGNVHRCREICGRNSDSLTRKFHYAISSKLAVLPLSYVQIFSTTAAVRTPSVRLLSAGWETKINMNRKHHVHVRSLYSVAILRISARRRRGHIRVPSALRIRPALLYFLQAISTCQQRLNYLGSVTFPKDYRLHLDGRAFW